MFIDGLDEYDNKILAVLEKNARQSYSEIGEQVGLSRCGAAVILSLFAKRDRIMYNEVNVLKEEAACAF